jgi:hypothetical protein
MTIKSPAVHIAILRESQRGYGTAKAISVGLPPLIASAFEAVSVTAPLAAPVADTVAPLPLVAVATTSILKPSSAATMTT